MVIHSSTVVPLRLYRQEHRHIPVIYGIREEALTSGEKVQNNTHMYLGCHSGTQGET